jgi:DNA-binding NarL/FixJ family response regulator
MIRLAIVEDHPVVAAGIAEALAHTGDLEVVGTAQTVSGAVVLVAAQRPDVVLCDVMLGDRPSGFDLPSALDPPVPVLFFSSYDLPWFYTRAMDSGGAGYVLKTESMGHLTRAVEQVAEGGLAFPALILSGRGRLRAPSRREREIIVLAGHGHGNGEIASTLGISQKTVETHLARLFARYSVKSRTELVMTAIGQGWLSVAQTGKLRET